MDKRTARLANLRIASPCSVGWENMEGDERIRFCRECGLNVYNLSEMTTRQVESLVANTEGRICARLYRRADGTVLTRDCPVGLRAMRRRISRAAGAALTAIISLAGMGQVFGQKKRSCPTGPKIQRTAQDGEQSMVAGTIFDPSGAVVPGAKVTLINEETKQTTASTSSNEGKFRFPLLAPGKYTLTIEAPGFMAYRAAGLVLNQREALQADVALTLSAATMGILALPALPERPDGEGMVISGNYMRKLP